MDIVLILARIIHIVGGIIWVGAMIFMAAFLTPAIAEAGPDGAKVLGGLGKHGLMRVLPLAAISTLLAGIYLYWRVSSGFNRVYLKSGPGHAYAIGGILAIIAFGYGISVSRRSTMKAMQLGAAAGAASGEERTRLEQQATLLRLRAAKAEVHVAWLLGLAAVAMAMGRYV